jgi:membrane protease YdiL (CAAX protease family)
MQNLIIASSISQFMADISLGEVLMLAVGIASLVILIMWLVLYSGPLALSASPKRTNRLPAYLPFIPLIVWILLGGAATEAINRLYKPTLDWKLEFALYLANALIQVGLIAALLILAWHCFERRLKGFGLDFRTLIRDIPASLVNFIAVLPLVWLGIYVVDLIGRVMNPEFEMAENPGLTAITENPQMAMRVLMIVFIVVIVPVFEEVLFRGLFQSLARSYLGSPWLAIIAGSILFSLMHLQLHWLAIFILSLGLGYSYERGGSLWRPILIHAFFNATHVCAALLMET